jgi:hypothetical protein
MLLLGMRHKKLAVFLQKKRNAYAESIEVKRAKLGPICGYSASRLLAGQSSLLVC